MFLPFILITETETSSVKTEGLNEVKSLVEYMLRITLDVYVTASKPQSLQDYAGERSF